MLQRDNQNDREGSLRRYFEIVIKTSTTGPLLLAGAGILLTLFSFYIYWENRDAEGATLVLLLPLIFGLGVAAAGIIRFATIETRYRSALEATHPQPSDVEVDMWFLDSMQRLLQHSRNILNLLGSEREFSEPLVIRVPTLASTYGIPAEDLKWQTGKDNALRFAIHKIIIIYLTERHLAAYTCDFNFIRDVPLNESTREYHYQDVISVATYEWSQSFTLPTGQKLSASQIFRLSVASGECIEVRLENEQLRNMTKEDAVPTIAADQAVSTIRAMLREKKALAIAA
jgi:hypothetical protein